MKLPAPATELSPAFLPALEIEALLSCDTSREFDRRPAKSLLEASIRLGRSLCKFLYVSGSIGIGERLVSLDIGKP